MAPGPRHTAGSTETPPPHTQADLGVGGYIRMRELGPCDHVTSYVIARPGHVTIPGRRRGGTHRIIGHVTQDRRSGAVSMSSNLRISVGNVAVCHDKRNKLMICWKNCFLALKRQCQEILNLWQCDSLVLQNYVTCISACHSYLVLLGSSWSRLCRYGHWSKSICPVWTDQYLLAMSWLPKMFKIINIGYHDRSFWSSEK